MSYGFTFNGTHCNSVGVIMKSKNRQVLPEVNDSYVQMSGRHGSYLYPGELSDRIITLECAVAENSLEALREKARQIAAWLYTKERAVLSFDDEPDRYYLGKISGAIDPEQLFILSTFDLAFRCEPLAYGAEVEANFVSDSVTVNNPGTFEALPIFNATFTAIASEWKVTLGTKYVRVVHSFQIGDTLEVNCATGAVLINGARAMDKLDWQNSEFFTLPPGTNTLEITPATVCTATVRFNPRWL